MTLIFYYQYRGKTWLVRVKGRYPPKNSEIWNCNTCVAIVPGTYRDDEPEDDDEF